MDPIGFHITYRHMYIYKIICNIGPRGKFYKKWLGRDFVPTETYWVSLPKVKTFMIPRHNVLDRHTILSRWSLSRNLPNLPRQIERAKLIIFVHRQI
jgi:hypothetical protein